MAARKEDWKQILRYRMDNLFSLGPNTMMVWLGIISLVVIVLASVTLVLTRMAPPSEEPYNFIEAFWVSLLGAIGEGSVGGRGSTWTYRLFTIILTFASIFFISAFIGLITTGIHARMEDLRKGRSMVMENNHILILGWSQQVFAVLSELVAANSSRDHCAIVIFGPKEKTEMEDEIRSRISVPDNIRVVCRNGDPMEMDDLAIARPNAARSIIVLSPESDTPDADVLKVVLALTNHPDRRKQPYHIVAGIRNRKNIPVAEVVGKDEVEWINVGDMISRIIAQTSRQSGLSVVYNELLDFGKNEIYLHSEPALLGKSYREILNTFERCSVIGIVKKDGKPLLNPPAELILQSDDRIIVIADDDSLIIRGQDRPAPIQQRAILSAGNGFGKPERILILGWNWRGAMIVHELDEYTVSNSEVLVVADREGIEEALKKGCSDLKSLGVCYRHGDTTDRSILEELEPGNFDHIILLAYSDRFPTQRADAQTLITLLHLRDLAELNGYRYSIVTEMLDVRNRRLASVTRADDFIVSDRLISLMLAQVAENKVANTIFADIFNPDGMEIYLKPAFHYLRTGVAVNYATVVEAASRCGETAIGYRQSSAAYDASRDYGIIINPAKSSEIVFDERDCLIVFAPS